MTLSVITHVCCVLFLKKESPGCFIISTKQRNDPSFGTFSDRMFLLNTFRKLHYLCFCAETKLETKAQRWRKEDVIVATWIN